MRILWSLVLAFALCLVFAGEASVAGEQSQPGPDEFIAVDIMPEMIRTCAPEYPDSAKAAGIEGKVYVKALVDKTGKVASVKLLKTSGHDVLDRAAVAAVPECKFKPALIDEKPVAVWVTFPIQFQLDAAE